MGRETWQNVDFASIHRQCGGSALVPREVGSANCPRTRPQERLLRDRLESRQTRRDTCPAAYSLSGPALQARRVPGSHSGKEPWYPLSSLAPRIAGYSSRKSLASFERIGPRCANLVAEIFDPGTRYEYEAPTPHDIVRAFELDARFKDLGLGLVDGMVAAVYRVLTADRRDFGVIRVGPRLTRSA